MMAQIKEKSLSTQFEEKSIVISVDNLTKSYSNKTILKNISFKLKEGEILGIIGHNGAGKTTLLETIEGLRKLDEGEITVLDNNIRTHSKSIQKKLGVQLQQTSLFEGLTVRENLKLYSGLYGKKHNIDKLLGEFDLLEHSKTLAKNLSGGQFQKLKLCLSLVNSPDILFLDEPTTGLDPSSRRGVWSRIKTLQKNGCSIILTTHYMEEALSLCDRIIFIHQGKIIANDTPENLIKMLGFSRTIILDTSSKIDDNWFKEFPHKNYGDKIFISSREVTVELRRILEIVKDKKINLQNIHIQEANLDDVYMHLTNERLIIEETQNEKS
jgi:ABC-2 type transport system ATP-binding protein